MDTSLGNSCKQTLQVYDQYFVNDIGCPEKYKTYSSSPNDLYSQDSPTQEQGIVWDLDNNKDVTLK